MVVPGPSLSFRMNGRDSRYRRVFRDDDEASDEDHANAPATTGDRNNHPSPTSRSLTPSRRRHRADRLMNSNGDDEELHSLSTSNHGSSGFGPRKRLGSHESIHSNNTASQNGLSFDEGEDSSNAMRYPGFPEGRITTSFDFDDDDDLEDEADLKRYNLDFSSTVSADRSNNMTNQGQNGIFPGHRTPSSPYSSNIFGDGGSRNNAGRDYSVSESFPASISSSGNDSDLSFLSMLIFRPKAIPKTLWYSFQSVRQHARQRRAQRLLQQSEQSFRQSAYLCLSDMCDATDRGILLVAACILLWGLVIWKLPSQKQKIQWTVLGLIMFILRVATRPFLEWFAQHRRQRRQRLSSVDHDVAGSSPRTSLPRFAIPSPVGVSDEFQDEEPEIVVFQDEPEVELRRTNSHDNGDPAIHSV